MCWISQQGLQHVFDRYSAMCGQAATKISTKNWGIVFLKTTKAVYSARERKYTAAGGDVQVTWGGIYEWPKSDQRDWYTD